MALSPGYFVNIVQNGLEGSNSTTRHKKASWRAKVTKNGLMRSKINLRDFFKRFQQRISWKHIFGFRPYFRHSTPLRPSKSTSRGPLSEYQSLKTHLEKGPQYRWKLTKVGCCGVPRYSKHVFWMHRTHNSSILVDLQRFAMTSKF